MSKSETKYDESNLDILMQKKQRGEETEKNSENAFYWYQIGPMIIKSRKKGSTKYLEKFFHWFLKATENEEDKDAQYNLAVCYINGEGIEKNLEKAFYWFQKAAENGNIDAQCCLGYLYYTGEGAEKNLEKAFCCTRKQQKMMKMNILKHN